MDLTQVKNAKIVPLETDDIFQPDLERNEVIRKALTTMNKTRDVRKI
jgi:hypothetical protein